MPLDLEQAKAEARKLSLEQWNRYFHVIEIGEGQYKVDRYYDDNSKFYALKGEVREQK